MRVIRALHESDIEAVAVYSTADERSLHVRLADRAICIGPPQASESYLRIPSLVAAATTTGCEAVHPGWGFLAENPAFVEACADNDLVFVGPGADVMARMGDKVQAKAELKAAEVPLVPGTEGATGLDDAREAADGVGYPVLLKATAGGGGKGMRLVRGPDELDSAYSTAALEAEAAFGDGSLYLEKAIAPARHVEIQVLADGEGGVLTLGERECSIQRRHQKLIEESPSPALDDDTREAMEAAAERACRTIGYRNAGTFEFLLGPNRSFYFIELNARLQVEHPVTEMVTGIDLVREQLKIAAGEPLTRHRPGRAPGTCARGPHQRRGPLARLRAGAGTDLPTARTARARGAAGHLHRGRGSRCHPTTTRCSASSSSGTRPGRRRSPGHCGRWVSSRSKACRPRASSRWTSSGARSSPAATTRRAT